MTLKPPSTCLLRNYYPGLNELRAVAALSVLLSHIEQMKDLAGLPSKYWFPIPGKLGVILFFALSGFLITSILVGEKSVSGVVSLKTFYLKRVLRIWPLYFLTVGLSLLVINRLTPFQVPMLSELAYRRLDPGSILLLLLILPNYVEIFIPYLTQIWSIGIEEQFYLVQPCVVKFCRSEKALTWILAVAVFSREIFLQVNKFVQLPLLHDIANQSVYSGCIAIGCLGALLCKTHGELVTRTLHHVAAQIAAVVIFVLLLIPIATYKDAALVDYRIHALLFIVIIINAATNPLSRCNLNSRVLDYIGKISYGIYMYHEFGIGCAIALIREYCRYVTSYTVLQAAVYSISLLITLAVSDLSYRLFEKYFLELKNRLT